MGSSLATAAIVAALLVSDGDNSAAPERPAPRPVLKIQFKDEPITPVTLRFVRRALREAEDSVSQCLVIELDTPGGLLQSTREMVRDILESRVPVVVYVSPKESRAASAGLFITLSAHVAAMAPDTRIGAAHPVQLGGLPGTPPSMPAPETEDEKEKKEESEEKEKPAERRTPMQEKIVNDTVAWARSLAELRGRNADWAAVAVSESKVVGAAKALELGVIDLVAKDFKDLLQQLDGREISLDSKTVRLSTADAEIRTLDMWWGEHLLAAISNPTVAFLLLMFGFYGILFELNSPGWGVGGTLGVICLVLGFYGLSVLPVNYVGLALIIVAMAMFVAEAFVTSFGTLTIGGIVCLILGGLMLIESPTGFMQVSTGVVVAVAVATAAITVFLVSSVVKAHLVRPQTGTEGLVGQPAEARGAFSPDGPHFKGTVFAHGEYWDAVSAEPIGDRQSVRINERRGLTLVVKGGEPSEAEAR